MTERPLRIGVTACFDHADPKRALFKGKTLLYVEESMLQYVMRNGALPVMLPRSLAGFTPAALLEGLDGLLLQGGADVSPTSYGEEPLEARWSGDRVRDDYEAALIKESIARDKPILGICRGAQILNVALGGTLFQDINTQISGSLVHRNWDVYDGLEHEVELVSGGRIADIYSGAPTHRINSIHHQSIKDPAPGLSIEARSPADGVIEAVVMTEYADATELPYVVGVQWHPEFHQPGVTSLFEPDLLMNDFLAEVRRRS